MLFVECNELINEAYFLGHFHNLNHRPALGQWSHYPPSSFGAYLDPKKQTNSQSCIAKCLAVIRETNMPLTCCSLGNTWHSSRSATFCGQMSANFTALNHFVWMIKWKTKWVYPIDGSIQHLVFRTFNLWPNKETKPKKRWRHAFDTKEIYKTWFMCGLCWVNVCRKMIHMIRLGFRDNEVLSDFISISKHHLKMMTYSRYIV